MATPEYEAPGRIRPANAAAVEPVELVEAVEGAGVRDVVVGEGERVAVVLEGVDGDDGDDGGAEVGEADVGATMVGVASLERVAIAAA